MALLWPRRQRWQSTSRSNLPSSYHYGSKGRPNGARRLGRISRLTPPLHGVANCSRVMVEQGSPVPLWSVRSQHQDAAMNKMHIFTRQLRRLKHTMRVLFVLVISFSTSSIPPMPMAMAQPPPAASAIFECPQRCRCAAGFTIIACRNVTTAEISSLLLNVEFPLQRLRNLSITHSELNDLAFLPSQLHLLSELELSNNLIERLEWPASPHLAEYPSLVRLDLGGNRLRGLDRDAFLPFPNVEQVDVAHNELFTVDWEAFRLFKLRRLSLAWNRLPVISDHMLRFTPNLESLDLSHNQLSTVQSSSFFAAQRLRALDLSHNRIQHFNYDSFSPLFQDFLQLEMLDISFNNLSKIPPDLRQFIAIRSLNLSGNPLERVEAGDLIQPVLQILNISHCPKLRLVESMAFYKLPALQTVVLSHNPRFEFLSGSVFGTKKPQPSTTSSIYEVDLSADSIRVISPSLVRLATRLHLAGNPLDCGCMLPALKEIAEHLVDAGEVDCLTQKTQSAVDTCDGEPLTPMGVDLRAEVGSYFKLYCAPPLDTDLIEWTFPNGSRVQGLPTEEVSSPHLRGDNYYLSPMINSPIGSPFLGGLFPPQAPRSPLQHGERRRNGRVLATRENIRFETLTTADAGEYVCAVHGPRSTGGGEKRLRLTVQRPDIAISIMEIGSHFASVMWNDSLKVLKASERVQLSIDVKDGHGQEAVIVRAIQLSLHNPWYSYNVMRLRPLHNYTFCLVYRLKEDEGGGGSEENEGDIGMTLLLNRRSVTSASILFDTCVEGRTQESLNFWNSLSTSTLVTIVALMLCLGSLLCGRGLYLRFYIWHETKMRSRMNQSISGQSFLSHSTSTSSANQVHALNNGHNTNTRRSVDASVTFKNHSAKMLSAGEEAETSIALNSLQSSSRLAANSRSPTNHHPFNHQHARPRPHTNERRHAKSNFVRLLPVEDAPV